MCLIAATVGRFEVETSTDDRPYRLVMKDRALNAELTDLLPADVTDLIYALKQIQSHQTMVLAEAFNT